MQKRLRTSRIAIAIGILLLGVAGYFIWQSQKNFIEAQNNLKLADQKTQEVLEEKIKAQEAEKVANTKTEEAEQAKEEALKSDSLAQIEKLNALASANAAKKAQAKAEKQALRSFVLQMAGTAKDWVRTQEAAKKTDAAQLLLIVLDSLEKTKTRPPTPFLSTLYQVEDAVNKHGKINSRFIGHNAHVSSVNFSPDGSNILTGSWDNTAILWDLKGNPLQKFKEHTSDVYSVSFSPDGSNILTGSWDNTAILWDTPQGIIRRWREHSLAPIPPARLATLGLLPSVTTVLTKPTVEQYHHALYHYQEENYEDAKTLFQNLYKSDYYFSTSMLESFKKCLEVSLEAKENTTERKLLEEVEGKLEEG